MPAVTRYQIASRITPISYVSHRSAFEYYGYTNQVSYEMNVSSVTEFGNLDTKALTTHIFPHASRKELLNIRGYGLLTWNGQLWTYIGDFDHIGRREELLRSLEMIFLKYAACAKGRASGILQNQQAKTIWYITAGGG